jgi:hypothetical protein
MDKSQAHAFVHFLLAFRESRMESSRFVGKLRTKARYTLLLLFLARWLAGSVGSSHFVGELRTKARYTLLRLFLVRSLPEVIQGLTSLCHPTAGYRILREKQSWDRARRRLISIQPAPL